MARYCARCKKEAVTTGETHCKICSEVKRRSKNRAITYVLWAFLWPLSLHWYYLKSPLQAIIRGLLFITGLILSSIHDDGLYIFIILGILGAWSLLDLFIFIPRTLNRMEDKIEHEVRREYSLRSRD